MKVIVFGSTGMIGQGVLRECLLDAEVSEVLAIGRSRVGRQHAKLKELIHADLLDYATIADRLRGYDACFFCLGISSAGMSEPDYTRVTYDIPLAAAKALAQLNPQMTFIYVSGAGTDSSENSRTMWARVKGRAENAIAALPFKATYMFRPGAIQPLHGITSRTASYRVFYTVFGPLFPLMKRMFPASVTTTESLGLAMLKAAKHGAPRKILESRDINALLAT